MPRRNSSKEMADVEDSRLQQVGLMEPSRRSSRTEHEHPRRQHGTHRHRRKGDDEKEDRTIVYVYKNTWTSGSSQANVRSQDRLDTSTASTTRRSRSTRSNHQRPEGRGLFSRRTTSLVDVVSKPLTNIVEGGRETSSSYERLMKRPTTRKRHSEMSRHSTDQPRVTRYDRHLMRKQRTDDIRSSSLHERSLPPARPSLQRSSTTVRHQRRAVSQSQVEEPAIRDEAENVTTDIKQNGRGSRVVYSLFGIPSVVPPEPL